MERPLASQAIEMTQKAIEKKAENEIGSIFCGIENSAKSGRFQYHRSFDNEDVCRKCVDLLRNLNLGYKFARERSLNSDSYTVLTVSWRPNEFD